MHRSHGCPWPGLGGLDLWTPLASAAPAHHSSFFVPNVMAIFRRWPHKRRCQIREGIKDRNFRPISRFISEMIHDKAIDTMERQWELVYAIYRMQLFEWSWVTCRSDLAKYSKIPQSQYPPSVWRIMTRRIARSICDSWASCRTSMDARNRFVLVIYWCNIVLVVRMACRRHTAASIKSVYANLIDLTPLTAATSVRPACDRPTPTARDIQSIDQNKSHDGSLRSSREVS